MFALERSSRWYPPVIILVPGAGRLSMWRSTLVAACILLAWLPSSVSSAPNLQQIDSLLDVLETHDRLVCQFSISQGDRVLYSRAVGAGQRDKSGRVMLTGMSDMLRVGSVTKAFTSVLVHKMVEEGKLSFDTSLGSFFPDVENASTITVDHMLSHTSGMHDFSTDVFGEIGDSTSWVYARITADSVLSRFRALGSDFPPGTRFGYSNTAYFFLGVILERVSGETYAQLVDSRICRPLGLKRTRVLLDRSTGPDLPASFVRSGREWEGFPTENCVHVGGAGAIVSTTDDLCRFGAGLFGHRLISARSLEHMLQVDSIPGVERGMVRNPTLVPGKMTYQHLGGIDAYRAVLMCIPEDSVSIAMLVNGGNFPFGETFLKLLDASQGLPISIPAFGMFEVPRDSLALYAGVYRSPAMGMEMHVTLEGTSLIAQVAGQDAFPVEAISMNRFQSAEGDFLMTFRRDVKMNAMNLFSYQGVRADNVRWDRVE
jgi:D-alanyl-D-alanine carboxypeptidase